MEKIKKLGMREAYGEALLELGKENKDIVAVVADLAGSTKVDNFRKEFPERFFNIGIDESVAAGFAAGLAKRGKTVFFSTYAIFACLAWSEIRQMICHENLPVKLVMSHGGLSVGPDGASHQALEDIALMRVLPNMKVIVPADAVETKATVKAAVHIPGPVYIRLPREEAPEIYKEPFTFTMGQARIHSQSKDAAIFVAGPLLEEALAAKKELKEKYGLKMGVINMSSIKPIDVKAIRTAAKKSKILLALSDHSMIGGLGSSIAEVLAKEGIGKPLKMLEVPDCFGESGTSQELKEKHGLTKKKIIEIITNHFSCA